MTRPTRNTREPCVVVFGACRVWRLGARPLERAVESGVSVWCGVHDELHSAKEILPIPHRAPRNAAHSHPRATVDRSRAVRGVELESVGFGVSVEPMRCDCESRVPAQKGVLPSSEGA